MSVTNRIKLKSVNVGDPNLIVEFEVEDTGTFLTFVKVLATVTLPNTTSPVQSNGIGQSNVAPNTPTDVTVNCPFPDGTFGKGQNFGYNISAVQFSNDQQTWTPYTGPNDGLSWNGSVQSSNVPEVQATSASKSPTPNPAGSNLSFWDKIVLFFRKLFG